MISRMIPLFPLHYPGLDIVISNYTNLSLSLTSFVRKKQLFHECD